MASRAISLRLPEQMAAELAAIARTQDVPVSEVVRQAVEDHIASRFADEDFQRRLKKHLEEELEILKRLAK
ncbi:MAG TPA: ribbon-helix-helix protein, CopG family [Solirubrobacterales bacterium]